MADPFAIAFFDVEGYTAFTATHGDEAGLALADSLLDIAEQLVEGARGSVVKRLGDGLMARFPTAEEAVRCALGTQRALQVRVGLEQEAPVAAAKVGIHWGSAVERNGDLFGNDVNLAARLVDKARGGQVLVTEPVINELGNAARAIDAKRCGTLRAKGIRRGPAFYQVRPRVGGEGLGPLQLGAGILSVYMFDAPALEALVRETAPDETGEQIRLLGGVRQLIPDGSSQPPPQVQAFDRAVRTIEAALNRVGARVIFTGVNITNPLAPTYCSISLFPSQESLTRFLEGSGLESFHAASQGVLEQRVLGAYLPVSQYGFLFPEGPGADALKRGD
jgi:class 3 adenylate cyclase